MNNSFLSGLNDAQKEAVINTEGYVRVVAGPGSGKTRTLVNRYGYLISNCGISSDNILCITFTNKAADVMKSRLKKIFGNNFSGYIHTFHGFCARILRDEIFHINYPKSFNILDEQDLESIYKDIYEKLSIDKKEMNYKQFADTIGSYKKFNIESYIEFLTDPLLSKKIDAPNSVVEFLKYQRKNYYLDFNDLIYMCLYIFEKYPDVLKKYQEKFQYVLIDEFQDVTESEFTIAQFISDKHKKLFVVGDPDQMIYSWRGAKDYIYSFDKIYPNCKTIFLNTNYRSTPEIIELSNSLIKHNSERLDKQMKTDNMSFAKPIYYHAKSRDEEANWICSTIKEMISSGESANNIAIIYRTNRNSRFVEEGLLKANISYRIYGSIGFYERKEIKDLISYLRFVINFDDVSFKRIINTPSRQFGNKKIQFLTEKQKENGKSLYENLLLYKNDAIFKGSKVKEFIDLINSVLQIKNSKVSDILSFLYQKSGYEENLITKADDERIDNVNELLESIKNYEDSNGEKLTLLQYIENITLVANSDKDDDSIDKVKMMTVHISKGQEFKYVFVCALNENNFPISRATTQKQMEEERRLAYVAFTRAEKQLYLSDAEGFDYATSGEMTPSRFIFDINPSQIEWIGAKLSDKQKNIQSISNYTTADIDYQLIKNAKIGQRVRHISFGIGTIIEIDLSKNGLNIKFDQLSTNRFVLAIKNVLSLMNDYPYVPPRKNTTNENAWKYITVNEIIHIYKISRYRAMKIVHSGVLKIYKQGNKYMLIRQEVEEYFRKEKIKLIIASIIFIIFVLAFIIILIKLTS